MLKLLTQPNQPFEIHVDASETGIGAVLTKNRNPIADFLRKFNEIEARYSVTEKEAYAAYLCILKWSSIIGDSN